jgi:hypothetical protein
LSPLQNVCLAGGPSDEGENESSEEEGDLEAHLLPLGASRESLRPRLVKVTSELPTGTGDLARFHRALHSDRDAAACSAARLPMRC